MIYSNKKTLGVLLKDYGLKDVLSKLPKGVETMLTGTWIIPPSNIDELLVDYFQSERFTTDIQTIKEWYDKGNDLYYVAFTMDYSTKSLKSYAGNLFDDR